MDSGAFAYCSSLSTLIIPSGLTSLSTLNEGSIFEGSGIKAVYVAWQAPVPAGQFFKGLDLSQATLYVPQGQDRITGLQRFGKTLATSKSMRFQPSTSLPTIARPRKSLATPWTASA